VYVELDDESCFSGKGHWDGVIIGASSTERTEDLEEEVEEKKKRKRRRLAGGGRQHARWAVEEIETEFREGKLEKALVLTEAGATI
jgi:hypothetical protein